MHIRPARPQDAQTLRILAQQGYGKYTVRIGKPPAPISADFDGHIARGEAFVLDLPQRQAGQPQIAGYVICFAQGDALELDNLAVGAAHQGQGLGGALIRFVEARARLLGFSAVTLYTNVAMVENLRMYPYLGYRETGRRQQNGYDRVFFRKDLCGLAGDVPLD